MKTGKRVLSLIIVLIMVFGLSTFSDSFLSEVINFKAYSATDTEYINGFEFTKIPYTSNGITVTNVSFTTDYKFTVTIHNNTGSAMENESTILWKCYDSSNSIIYSQNHYLEAMNNGESCKIYLTAPTGTVKILFGEATVYTAATSIVNNTNYINGFEFSELPYTSNGITVSGVSFSTSYKFTATIRNNTGSAITNKSTILWKCYDSSNSVIYSQDHWLESLNNGESCEIILTAPIGTVKILFGNAKVEKDNIPSSSNTEYINGFEFTKLPYTSNGITVTNVSFTTGYKFTVTIHNNTGSAIENESTILWKCYDSSNSVIYSQNHYLEAMNNGESCKIYLTAPTGTVKILFGEAVTYKNNGAKAIISAPTGTKQINWKYKAHLVASATNLPQGCHIAWYEGETKISDESDFTTESLTSNHTYTAKIVDASGKPVSSSAQEKTVTIEVKSDFFSKLISFFMRLFGSDVTKI